MGIRRVNFIRELKRRGFRLPERYRKIVHCLNNGSQLGWLIDPEEDLVIVLFPQENIRICDGSDMELPLPQFIRDMDIEFKLTVGDLFSYLTQ